MYRPVEPSGRRVWANGRGKALGRPRGPFLWIVGRIGGRSQWMIRVRERDQESRRWAYERNIDARMADEEYEDEWTAQRLIDIHRALAERGVCEPRKAMDPDRCEQARRWYERYFQTGPCCIGQ